MPKSIRTGGSTGDPALAFVAKALDRASEQLPGIDVEAMQLVLLLHRVTNVVTYDLESIVHRPAGWSWSAFRALFTLWISGPLEPSKLATESGMSRQAVSALAKTLASDGLIERTIVEGDGRSIVLSLTKQGQQRLEKAFRQHNVRESEWVSALSATEQRRLSALLTKLADAGQQSWVSHRF